MRNNYRIVYCTILFFFTPIAFATPPTEFFREWSKIDVTGPYYAEWRNLRYEAFVESRNQETRLDFSTGYRFSPLVSVWSGFTWISPNDGRPQIYRPWQQVISELVIKNPVMVLQLRSRMEELKQEGQPEWSLRWRERVRLAFPEKLGGKFTPVFYDEIFLNLNQPAWVNTRFIDQNRLFLGVDSPVWKNTFVEIGYINQYFFQVPVDRIAHILSVSWMIELP